MPPPENASPVPPFDISKTCHEKYYLLPFDHKFRQSIISVLKGLCQLESMRSEVMQITSNCQNSIVFNEFD